MRHLQIDESMFGGRRKYNRGDHNKHFKSWVFGMVEEETGLNVLWMVDNRCKDTLESIITDHIVSGATVKSDEWSSYTSLTQKGYEHLTVNHSVYFVNEEGVHTDCTPSLTVNHSVHFVNEEGDKVCLTSCSSKIF